MRLRVYRSASNKTPPFAATACGIAALVAAGSTVAQDVALCGTQKVAVESDGRLLNHFPYASAARTDLVRPPRGNIGQCAAIHRDMRADLEALIARAEADPSIRGQLVVLSCYRSREHQTKIFCRNGRSTPLIQAYQVAPPGYSEHATGLAIDFGGRRGRCQLIGCFASTKVGRWLAENAPHFGFEMSFPKHNAQGVAFEPWHWRWVGRGAASKRAQMLFGKARERFSASPYEVLAVTAAEGPGRYMAPLPTTVQQGSKAGSLLGPPAKATASHSAGGLNLDGFRNGFRSLEKP